MTYWSFLMLWSNSYLNSIIVMSRTSNIKQLQLRSNNEPISQLENSVIIINNNIYKQSSNNIGCNNKNLNIQINLFMFIF